MAELATIARPYAEALFKVAASGGAQEWLDPLAAVGSDPTVLQFAGDPKVNAGQIFHIISGVLPSPLPPQGVNFLRMVIENGRLAALPEIARLYRDLANRSRGTADAVVQSAYPIHSAALGELQASLEQRFKRPLNLSVQVVPELIGGVRVVVGDEVYDTSIKAQLDQMKTALVA